MPDLPVTTPPELAPLSFVLGRWRSHDGVEDWIAAGDVLFGVSFGPRGFYEVLTLRVRDGRVEYVARPRGGAPVAFARTEADTGSATFTNPAHDDPQRIRYELRGENRLVAGIGPMEGPDRATFKLRRAELAPAPELEAADRAFHDAVVARGVAAWVAAFDPAGHQFDDAAGTPVPPGPVMEAYMAGTLAGRLDWEPVGSGLSPAGDLGWTVGSWTWTPPDATEPAGRGAYVTVWRKQDDGSWKVWFDAGDPLDSP